MDNQHRKITGYTELTQEQIDLMNEVKAISKATGKIVEKLRGSNVDVRWVDIGASDLQKGFMSITRSVAKPDFF